MPEPDPAVVRVVGAGAVVNGISVITTEEVDLSGLREGTVERRLSLEGLPEHAGFDGDPHVSVRYDVARDLDDGSWDGRYGHLRQLAEFDAGMRLVLAHP